MARDRVKESGSVIGTVPSADRTAVTSGCGTGGCKNSSLEGSADSACEHKQCVQ